MGKGRLEAFSDGVIAIIITIMVLEFKVPEEPTWPALLALLPHVLIYALSFVYVGIYWSNHHHMFQAAKSVTGGILWANLHLLFWLSLIPFASAWMGAHYRESLPVAVYGGLLFLCGFAYQILEWRLIAHEGPDSVLAKAVGTDVKGKASVGAYLLAIAVAPFEPLASLAIYALVALVWRLPDQRIEKMLGVK
jgi:uncharacterized membrane protein